jgi:hypothetical protein
MFLENLCNDISFSGMDEDDKIAIVQTMKTVEIELVRTSWRPGRRCERYSCAMRSGIGGRSI